MKILSADVGRIIIPLAGSHWKPYAVHVADSVLRHHFVLNKAQEGGYPVTQNEN